MSRSEWLTNCVVPEIVEREGGVLAGVEVGSRQGGNATDGGFASSTFRIKLKVKKDEKEQELHLIAKVIPEIPELRQLHGSERQFANEIHWYTEVIPIFEALADGEGAIFTRDLWPKCYFCLQESPELATIVMQDLKKDGYELARQPAADLNFEHAVFALERLAAFHALSYATKNQNPEGYAKIVQEFQETWFRPEKKEEYNRLLGAASQRGITPLRSRADCSDLVAALDKAIADSPYDLQKKLVEPRDKSTSVLCHGDFNRNNMLFKYQTDSDIMSDLRLIDFATMRESSPAIDISFFLCISVTPSAIEGAGLRNLLTRYHSALVAALKKLSGPEDPWKGDVTALETELGRHVLYSYCICSFFLGVMMLQGKGEEFSIEDMVKLSPEEQVKNNIEMGGEKVTQRLVDMLLDWKDRGFHKLWN